MIAEPVSPQIFMHPRLDLASRVMGHVLAKQMKLNYIDPSIDASVDANVAFAFYVADKMLAYHEKSFSKSEGGEG